jgi:hypothetical protein
MFEFLTYLIDSKEKYSFLLCLASCNSNPNCLTIIFQENEISLNPENCSLFSKKFQDIEFSASMGTDLYVKISYNRTFLNVRLLNGKY